MSLEENSVNPQTLSEERFAEIDLSAFLSLVSAATEVTADTDDVLRDAEAGITAKDWDEIKPRLVYSFPGPYKGRKVNDMGFWNLIKDRVSQEGYEFLADAGGYYSNTINWNAAEHGYRLAP